MPLVSSNSPEAGSPIISVGHEQRAISAQGWSFDHPKKDGAAPLVFARQKVPRELHGWSIVDPGRLAVLGDSLQEGGVLNDVLPQTEVSNIADSQRSRFSPYVIFFKSFSRRTGCTSRPPA